MQPIVPYLLGEAHPSGKRLVNIQKCIRTDDIDEVGDKSHLTFFEMVGHWSLGDYFKKEEITMIWRFLTSPEEGLGLEPRRLYVTVFEGDTTVPLDQEAIDIWKELIPEHRIYALNAKENWWSAGANGPCGPDTEYFYDTTEEGLGDLSREDFLSHCETLNIIEIANSVFMQYRQEGGVVVGKLGQTNIDFGGGLERWTSLMQETDSVYETDLFAYYIEHLGQHSEQGYEDKESDYRVICDHLRSTVFMIADGARPSNKDQGYIVRRLLRRAVGRMRNIAYNQAMLASGLDLIIQKYEPQYPNLRIQRDQIIQEIEGEVHKFTQTLEQGLSEFHKIVDTTNHRDNICIQDFGEFDCTSQVNELSAQEAFKLHTTYGFPVDLMREEATRYGLHMDEVGLGQLLTQHQDQSRTASSGKFKGGLSGDSPKIRALHTATHLLLAGLRHILGDHVYQAGSNTTEERIRFDFTHPEKVTPDLLREIEQFVNEAIEAQATVSIEEMPKEVARESGVVGSFWETYPDVVKVYTITGPEGHVYSRELCGGPHVETTQDLATFGKFIIKKEESSSAGVRRIKAVLA